MSQVIDFLKDINLDKKETLSEYIWKSSTKELLGLITHMQGLIENDYKEQKYSPFSFVPNDDLAATNRTNDIDTKVKRANKFAIFSSLYADNVYIQLDLITDFHGIPDNIYLIDLDFNQWHFFRYRLEGDIAIINAYSKLIEAEIVHIMPLKEHVSKECYERKILGLDKCIDLEPIKKELRDKAKFIIGDNNGKGGLVKFDINNINEFIGEAGFNYICSNRILNTIPKENRELGMEFNNRKFTDKVMDDFVDMEFGDSCYYTELSSRVNAKFITNKISDGMFMEMLGFNNKFKSVLDYYNTLPKYDLPFIDEITIDKALNLREIEGESFNEYRIALNKAIKEQCKTNSNIEWKEIYDDILFPKFNKLDMELKKVKSGFYMRTFCSIVLAITQVSAGMYTMMEQDTMSEILKLVALGTPSAISLIYQILDQRKKTKSLRDNEYYFLWRLKKNIDGH